MNWKLFCNVGDLNIYDFHFEHSLDAWQLGFESSADYFDVCVTFDSFEKKNLR